MDTLANSEEPDEMQHNAAFLQGLRCLLRLKPFSGTETRHYLESSTCKKYTMDSHLLNLSICMGKSIRIQRYRAISLHIGVAPVR